MPEDFAEAEALHELRSKLRRQQAQTTARNAGSIALEDAEDAADDLGGDDQDWLQTFNFQQRHGKLNVRRLARLDLVQIVEKVDIGALQEVLENIAFCNLKVGDLHGLSDQSIVKAFRVAQLIIEYLLNLENALFAQVDVARADAQEASADAEQLAEDNQVLADENDRLRKELRQKRKALATFEYVLTVHGPGGASVKETLANALAGTRAGAGLDAASLEASVCATCGKTFSTREFLRRHCARRKHAFTNLANGEEAENLEPNRAAENSAAGEALEELQQSLREAVKEREVAVQEAIEQTRELERKVHQEQLEILKTDRRAHEERVEAHYEARLSAQQLSYEQRIASLEAKLDVFRTLQWSVTGTEGQREERKQRENQEREQRERLDRLERELQLHRAQQEQQRSTPPRVDSPASLSSASSASAESQSLPSAEVNDDAAVATKRFRAAIVANFCRSLASFVRNRERMLAARAFSRLKVHSMDVSFALAKVDLARSFEELAEQESHGLGSTSPKHAVAQHVAKMAAPSDLEARPIPDAHVQQIALQYLHAQREENITEAERDAMAEAETVIDGKAAILASQYKVEAQAMNHAPMPQKPHVRSRWDHSSAEIHAQLDEVRSHLRARMARFDPELPDMDVLDDEQRVHLQRQIEIARRNEPNQGFPKALRAVKKLTTDLTDAFYKPPRAEDLQAFEDEFPRPRDKLLKEALVRIADRHKPLQRPPLMSQASFTALQVSNDDLAQPLLSYSLSSAENSPTVLDSDDESALGPAMREKPWAREGDANSDASEPSPLPLPPLPQKTAGVASQTTESRGVGALRRGDESKQREPLKTARGEDDVDGVSAGDEHKMPDVDDLPEEDAFEPRSTSDANENATLSDELAREHHESKHPGVGESLHVAAGRVPEPVHVHDQGAQATATEPQASFEPAREEPEALDDDDDELQEMVARSPRAHNAHTDDDDLQAPDEHADEAEEASETRSIPGVLESASPRSIAPPDVGGAETQPSKAASEFARAVKDEGKIEDDDLAAQMEGDDDDAGEEEAKDSPLSTGDGESWRRAAEGAPGSSLSEPGHRDFVPSPPRKASPSSPGLMSTDDVARPPPPKTSPQSPGSVDDDGTRSPSPREASPSRSSTISAEDDARSTKQDTLKALQPDMDGLEQEGDGDQAQDSGLEAKSPSPRRFSALASSQAVSSVSEVSAVDLAAMRWDFMIDNS